jgi:hypothetical protein
MAKILLICILIGYILYKLGSSVRVSTHSHTNPKPNQHKPSGGNVHVDAVPPKEEKKRSGFKGGEYVDYEEIK